MNDNELNELLAQTKDKEQTVIENQWAAENCRKLLQQLSKLPECY